MHSVAASTIAEFEFGHDPDLNLPLLVKELDGALHRSGAMQRRITWDCDDRAMLDVEGARFSISYDHDLDPHGAARLMISAGPRPDGPACATDPDRHEQMCQMIADRLKTRFSPKRMAWHQVTGPVTVDLIDDLFDRLPGYDPSRRLDQSRLRTATDRVLRAFPEMANSAPVTFAEKSQALKTARAERAQAEIKRAARKRRDAKPVPPAANILPDLPAPQASELSRVRDALYAAPAHAQSPSRTRMRLAAHTMDTTMILVCLPVGAAMLTYSVLKGGSVTASARMMAITCTLVGLAHQLPWANHLLQLI
jgi:hypothetical protein